MSWRSRATTTQPFDTVDAAPFTYTLLHPSPRAGPASVINVRPYGHTLIRNHAHNLSITAGTVPGIKSTHSGAQETEQKNLTGNRPSGPAVEGTWTDHEVALEKFRGWLGVHGSRDGVTIVLLEDTGGEREPLRTWTKERGEVIHRAA